MNKACAGCEYAALVNESGIPMADCDDCPNHALKTENCDGNGPGVRAGGGLT